METAEKKRSVLRVVFAVIAGCLILGIIGGFRSDIGIITALISAADNGVSYGEVSLAYSVYKIVGAAASPFAALLALKRSTRFLVLLGAGMTILGVVILALATDFVGCIIGLGICMGLGTAVLAFGVIFAAMSALLSERAAIIISSVLEVCVNGFGALFSLVIQPLNDSLGFTQMMFILAGIIACTIPFAFVLGNRKTEGKMNAEKKETRTLSVIRSVLSSKEIYILILIFFMTGFMQGVIMHFYAGELSAGDLSRDTISVIYSAFMAASIVASLVMAVFIPKIKRGFLAIGIVIFAFGVIEMVLFLGPMKDSFVLLVSAILILMLTMFYPLQNLVVRRKFSPVILASILCFLTMFDKIGAALNSAIGGLIFDMAGNFDILMLCEGIIGLAAGVIIFVYVLRGGDRNTEVIGTGKGGRQ